MGVENKLNILFLIDSKETFSRGGQLQCALYIGLEINSRVLKKIIKTDT